MLKDDTLWKLWHSIQFKHIKVVVCSCNLFCQEKWAYHFIIRQATPHVHFRSVAFVFNVGKWPDPPLRCSWCYIITCMCTLQHIILCKLGKFFFYLVKISDFYLVMLLSCNWSKVHQDFADIVHFFHVNRILKLVVESSGSHSSHTNILI